MQSRSFTSTSFTLDPDALRLLTRTANAHGVARSGLVNLAIMRLLANKTAEQIESLLEREGVKRRRAVE